MYIPSANNHQAVGDGDGVSAVVGDDVGISVDTAVGDGVSLLGGWRSSGRTGSVINNLGPLFILLFIPIFFRTGNFELVSLSDFDLAINILIEPIFWLPEAKNTSFDTVQVFILIHFNTSVYKHLGN